MEQTENSEEATEESIGLLNQAETLRWLAQNQRQKNVVLMKKSKILVTRKDFAMATIIDIMEQESKKRLNLFPENWFKDRAILDIGCNVGYLTLFIAKEFGPNRVLGIDIDENLIGVARKNIRHYCDEGTELIA
uniref:RNA methyltransferase n=1 Tax=Ditylenchus dipsaci TaxID=166011 RepID=A0A915EIJ1_9BILA